jgi:hypothetical protein
MKNLIYLAKSTHVFFRKINFAQKKILISDILNELLLIAFNCRYID